MTKNKTLLERQKILLTGIMGCGKSSIGRALASALDREFVDIDEMIEAEECKKISEIFQFDGEEHFRDLETQALHRLIERGNDDLVIATGGGIVMREQNRFLMKRGGLVIYIDRPVENIIGEINTTDRPLLAAGAERLISLFAQRESLYSETCDIHFKNNFASASEACNAIVSLL